MRTSNYDKFPFIEVPGGANCCVQGWTQVAARLRQAVANRAAAKTVLVVECYTGVDEEMVLRELATRLTPALTLHAADAMLPSEQIDALIEPFLGGDDPVFGFLCGLTLPQFFDAAKVDHLRSQAAQAGPGVVLIVGCGASLVAQPDILVYADLSRWEGQLRYRRNQVANLGASNQTQAASLQYKRAFFVDWRVCDRWKRPLIALGLCSRHPRPRAEAGRWRRRAPRPGACGHAAFSGCPLF